MVNKNKLMGIITQAGYNQTSFARCIGMNKNSFNAKINNKRDFRTGEIEKICSFLNIVNASEKVDIFLSKSSQK